MIDDDFLDQVDWSEHSRSAINSDNLKDVNRLIREFSRSIETNEFMAESLAHRTDEDSVKRLAKIPSRTANFTAALKLLTDYLEERENLLANAPQSIPAGQRIEIVREVTCGEDDVLVGTQGTITPTDRYPWPTPPEGKVAVTFDAAIFGFEVDEDDEDTQTLCFYIPKFALKLI